MKRSSGWSIAVMVGCLIVAYRGFSAGPFEFQPNWSVIIPLAALWTVLIGIMIRKEQLAAQAREQEADAEVAAAYANALEGRDRKAANA